MIGRECGRMRWLILLSVGAVLGMPASRAVGQDAHVIVAEYRAMRSGAASTFADGKCGFRWAGRIAEAARRATPSDARVLFALMQPAAMQTDTVIGHFRIAFDTTGIDAPALLDGTGQRIPGSALAFVDSVGRIFNTVWSVEIDQMGFDPPPLAVDGTYHLTIREEGTSYYGMTNFEDPPINPGGSPLRYHTNIEVDNDFKGFYSSGIKGLEVTAAHEFNHAIQVGAYGYWDADVYAYELTSTWLEDAVYTEVNDYYQYLNDFFNGFRNGRSFYDATYPGYERCVWGHYFARTFGVHAMPEVWKRMASMRFLPATDATLRAYGSSLAAAYAEFATWNYFTADRADTTRSYPEGRAYPRFVPAQEIDFTGSTSTAEVNAFPLSLTMDAFAIHGDTLTALVTNVDVTAALATSTTAATATVKVSTGSTGTPYQVLADGLRVGIAVTDAAEWRTDYFQASVIGDAPRMAGDPFPNPVVLSRDVQVFLPVEGVAIGQSAEVLVVSSSMNRVLQQDLPVVAGQGREGIIVPTSLLKAASTGIHFVTARLAGKSYLWKVALIR